MTTNNDELFGKCTVAHERMAKVETRLDTLDRAFVKNDLNEADYDGHRRAHADMIESEKMLTGYKNSITTKVGAWAAIGAISAFGAVLLDWVKDHLR